MPTVTSSTIVPASAEEAFGFIDDYRNIPKLQPHFTSAVLVGELETGLGAEVALDGRFHGVPMRVRNRIIGYTFPSRLVSVSEGTVLSRSTWQLEPLSTDPPTTRVTLTLDYKLQHSLGGLLLGLGASFFNREVQNMTDESLRHLRELLSGEEPYL